MRSSRRKFNNQFSNRENFDKKVDQFLEVGRQFVDGVSGTRPGSRRNSSISDFSRRNFKSARNWVGHQMDAFLSDDYEEWADDDFDGFSKEFKSFRRNSVEPEELLPHKKRYLEAISLRSKTSIVDEQKKLSPGESISNENWEEDSFFQINKWKRSSDKTDEITLDPQSIPPKNTKSRNFPRSRRRRI